MTDSAKRGIDRIKASVPPLTPSEVKLSKVERERYGIQNEGIRQDQIARTKYAHRIFVLCCCWVGAIYLLLLFAGFGSYRFFHFVLSERVLLAAIGSTTANILGVFLIVVRYLFPARTSRKDRD